MKLNKTILFSIILVLILTLVSACTNNNDSLAKENIEEFLNRKSDLYDKRNEIIYSMTLPLNPEEEEIEDERPKVEIFDDAFKDLKELLTEDEYKRLMANMYLIDLEFIDIEENYNYDKSEIEDIDYEKISDDEEKMVYKVKYTEKLYSKDELKEERQIENEFTLEKIDDDWLISYID